VFEVSQQKQQYQTYVLTDASTDSRLEVVPDRGGIITRWRVRGREILYLDAERFARPEMSVRGGIPILFPICGNLPDNTYTHQEKQYTLKQHGFARDLPWEVTKSEAKDDSASLTLILTSNEQTRAVYPFDFQLEFTYEFKGNWLGIWQRFVNHSSAPMPFSVGLHPYFLVSDKTDLRFEIPATQFQNQITKETHPFSGNFDFEQEELDLAFRPISAQKATVKGDSQQLQLTWSSNYYGTLVFWTIKGKDYYCLEPWTAPRNALNTGTDLIYIEPGDEVQTWVNLVITST
jgi:galactose mutarotase-like enzyme